jgi:hypothetical protein
VNFKERISAVLHGERPDRVPYAPYDNLVPRGDFERELRNRGMGLCLRRQGIWADTTRQRAACGARDGPTWAGSATARASRRSG